MVYNIGLQKYKDKKIKVCGKDSIHSLLKVMQGEKMVQCNPFKIAGKLKEM